jgi:hypothetical protein
MFSQYLHVLFLVISVVIAVLMVLFVAANVVLLILPPFQRPVEEAILRGGLTRRLSLMKIIFTGRGGIRMLEPA